MLFLFIDLNISIILDNTFTNLLRLLRRDEIQEQFEVGEAARTVPKLGQVTPDESFSRFYMDDRDTNFIYLGFLMTYSYTNVITLHVFSSEATL